MADITLDDAVTIDDVNVIGAGTNTLTPGVNSLEVLLDAAVETVRIDVTFAAPLTGTSYLVFDIEIPFACEWEYQVVESSGDRWGNHPMYTWVDGTKRLHHSLFDIEPLDGQSAAGNPDFADISEIRFVVRIPTSAQYGWPTADANRVFTISDLHLVDVSPDIAAADAAGAATLTVDATASEGPVNTAVWNGMSGLRGLIEPAKTAVLDTIGISAGRASIININDWEQNADFFSSSVLTDYDSAFSEAYDFYGERPFTWYPWIPCQPRYLWADPVTEPGTPPNDFIDSANQRPRGAFDVPASYPNLRQFIRDLVAEYRARGVTSPGFSPLNEPNGGSFWGGTNAEYREWFKEVGQAIKEQDPDAIVTGPSFGGRSEPGLMKQFILYQADNAGPLDEVSIHGYMHGDSSQLFRDIAVGIRRIVDEHPEFDSETMRISNNEWGYALRGSWFNQIRSPIGGVVTASAWLAMLDAGFSYALLFGENGYAQSGTFPGTGLYDADKTTARPVLYVLDLFNRLSGDRVTATSDQESHGVETLATVDAAGVVSVLCWWVRHGTGLEDHTKSVTANITLPAPGSYQMRRYLVDSSHGNRVVGAGYSAPDVVDFQNSSGSQVAVTFDLELYGTTLLTFTPVEGGLPGGSKIGPSIGSGGGSHPTAFIAHRGLGPAQHPNLIGWFRGDSFRDLALGATISGILWPDLSLFKNSASPVSSPTVALALLNGHRGVRLAPNARFNCNAMFTMLTGADVPYSYVAVFEADSAVTTQTLFSGSSSTDAETTLSLRLMNTAVMRARKQDDAGASANLDAAAATSVDPMVLAVSSAGTNSIMFKDGTQVAAGATNNGVLTINIGTIGGNRLAGTFGEPFTGVIYELLFYNALIDAAYLANLTAVLKQQYGIA